MVIALILDVLVTLSIVLFFGSQLIVPLLFQEPTFPMFRTRESLQRKQHEVEERWRELAEAEKLFQQELALQRRKQELTEEHKEKL